MFDAAAFSCRDKKKTDSPPQFYHASWLKDDQLISVAEKWSERVQILAFSLFPRFIFSARRKSNSLNCLFDAVVTELLRSRMEKNRDFSEKSKFHGLWFFNSNFIGYFCSTLSSCLRFLWARPRYEEDPNSQGVLTFITCFSRSIKKARLVPSRLLGRTGRFNNVFIQYTVIVIQRNDNVARPYIYRGNTKGRDQERKGSPSGAINQSPQIARTRAVVAGGSNAFQNVLAPL